MVSEWFLDFFNNTLNISAVNEFNILNFKFYVSDILALLFFIFTSIVIYEIGVLIKNKFFI